MPQAKLRQALHQPPPLGYALRTFVSQAVTHQPLLGRALVRAVGLLVAGCVWVATSISVGVSIWDVLRIIGRAAAGELATPAASVVLALLVLVGIAALYWLQRLLESEEESSQ